MTGKKILIVDDDKDLLRGLNIRLRATGYNVVVAKDAYSAVSVAVKEKPDLIILDIGLPGGDGFTVMDRLENLPQLAPIPVIILTAKDPAVSKERSLNAGAVSYFQKPADNEELLVAIRKVLGELGEHVESVQASQGFGKEGTSMTGKKILIVEDDQDLVMGLSVRLRANGYDVVVANDGYSAISVAQKERPALILLDLGLPSGDGFIVMERLRSMNTLTAIPIIILTARDPAMSKERTLSAGAKFFFQKPFDNEELMAAIRKTLGETEKTVAEARISEDNL